MPRKILSLNEILEKPFLTETDLETLGIRSRKTSQNLRSRGTDPFPFVRFKRTVRYPAKAIRDYVQEHLVMPEGAE